MSSLQSSGGLNIHKLDSLASIVIGIIPKDSLGKKGTHYRIINKQTDSVVYSSDSRSVAYVFGIDNRLLHYYRDNKYFYMFRVTEANLYSTKNTPFVYVLQVKLEASLNGDES